MNLKRTLNKLPLIVGLILIGTAIWNAPSSRGDRTPSTSSPTAKLLNTESGWRVKSGSVYDGDTLRLVKDGREIKVRLCGIDAPEKNQEGGIESRDYLRSLLPDGAEVSITEVEQDRYGRTVAEVWNDAIADTDQNVNAAMVLAGHAWHYEEYSGNCPNKDAIATAAQVGEKPQGEPQPSNTGGEIGSAIAVLD